MLTPLIVHQLYTETINWFAFIFSAKLFPWTDWMEVVRHGDQFVTWRMTGRAIVTSAWRQHTRSHTYISRKTEN